MDSLTHTVLGACVGQALAGKKIGKKAMLWGALANNLADIDVLTAVWMNQADSLLAHRGFTHSILFAVLSSPLLAYLFRKIYPQSKMSFKDWLWMWGAGNFIHLFIDAMTCYGTGWLEPFSHLRIAFNVLFVADLFYTLPILIAAIILLVISRNHRKRQSWARFGIYVSTGYLIYAMFNKVIIDRKMSSELERQKINYTGYFTNPTPLNNWLWYMAAKNDSGFYIGYRSVFDQTDTITFTFFPQHKELLDQLPSDPSIDKLIRFSQGYYTISKPDSNLYFSDIRFGQTIGWDEPNSNFVFRYIIGKEGENDLLIQRGRMEGSTKKAFASLWERIKGR